jgi:hypothetical protein
VTARRAAELTRLPSDYAIRDLPARVAVFLHAVGRHAAIRYAMVAGGYGAADHEEGLRLLAALCRYRQGGLDPAEDEPARAAGAELEEWTRTHVPRLRAALERLHPAEVKLFEGVDGSESGSALLGVGSLLERLVAVERADRRAAVLRTLAQRGLDRAERQRLGVLLAMARRALAPAKAAGEDDDEAADMIALHRWFSDWSATAKALLKRKDWLIWMGLAERRARQ